ncbi:hypothetical protein MVEN_01180000 [Mycena venus]|uniref:Uncharacterized protein n=1 Tax=Mycena venus TaxID=2733690 RepID=A0A8H7CYK2_9AGAR|nr:hypothetical protein MVEN_01180000 [Mycena venus]
MRALVSDTLTVFLHAYRPSLTGFGGTFQGFTVHPSEGEAILGHFAHVISEDASIARFVRSHRDAFPAHMTNDEVFAAFVQSLWVHPLQLKAKATSARTEITGWNLHFDSPTRRVDSFDELTVLKALVINTGTHGQRSGSPLPSPPPLHDLQRRGSPRQLVPYARH